MGAVVKLRNLIVFPRFIAVREEGCSLWVQGSDWLGKKNKKEKEKMSEKNRHVCLKRLCAFLCVMLKRLALQQPKSGAEQSRGLLYASPADCSPMNIG